MRVFKKGIGNRAVLLLHGAGSDNAMLSWREVLAQFDETKYTVYAPDLLGYGASDKPNLQGEQFFEHYIASVKQLTEALQLQQFVIAGLSMGGAIAIGFALKFAERVRAVVPVNTWGVTEKLPMHRLTYAYVHYTNLVNLQYRWISKSRSMAKWLVQFILIGNRTRITDALVNEVLDACKGDTAGRSMQQFQRSAITKTTTRPYYYNDLMKVNVPIIFVHGDKDPLVKEVDVHAAAAKAPVSKVEILKGCKHWSVKEQPQKFYEIIENIY